MDGMSRTHSFLSQSMTQLPESRAFVASVAFSSQVYQVEFSPFEYSQNVICVALKDKIVVGQITFQEAEDDKCDGIEFTVLQEFEYSSRIHAIAWSPDTSLSLLPKVLCFCTADAQFNVSIFRSDLVSSCTQKVLTGHSDYINAIAFDPEGNYIASTGDDHTCRLWPLKEGAEAIFYLTSPGMSVCWHRQEPSKLMVAEKNGLVHMYNVESQRAILSLDAGQFPLMAADWAPSNCSRVGCVSGGHLIVWDVTEPSVPGEERPIHLEGGRYLRFCPSSDAYVATIGRTDHQLKVSHVENSLPILSTTLQVPGGLSWHFRLPFVCAGSDRKLMIWKILTK